MLDENLPVFFLNESPDGIKYHSSFYLTRGGSDPEVAYSLHRLDPSLDTSRNCYAAALFDAFNPEILYGEVLVHPRWTQPTVSQDDSRRTNTTAIPPPPEPLMPTEFTIQLYNPDQQISVVQKSGGLVGAARWEFGIPQDTFRLPSGSILDRSQNDPGASTTTPKINFAWRKESKFGGKDLACVVTGKSTDVQVGKKKGKDPDIAVALAKGLREVTIYEPNLYRVDLEDPKGLEVCLLLSIAVIRDIYFAHTNLKQVFNISDGPWRTGKDAAGSPPLKANGAALGGLYAPPPLPVRNQRSQSQPAIPVDNSSGGSQPITDPRTQWEIDAETKRLKAQTEAEEREQRRVAEQRRREQEKADEEAAKRLRKLEEQKERERKLEQKKIDKETERLRKLYGQQQVLQKQPHQQPTGPATMNYAHPYMPAPAPAQHRPPLPIRPAPPPQSNSVPLMQSPFPARPYGSQLNYYGQHPTPPPQPPHSHWPGQNRSIEEPAMASATSGPFLQPSFDTSSEQHTISKRRSFGV